MVKYIRVSITDRCNLSCVYCVPAKRYAVMKPDDLLTLDELAFLIGIAIDLGIKKVRITGGEPLVRPGILDFVSSVSAYEPEDLALTTNGTLLKFMASELKGRGLKRVNISLSSVRPDRYERITQKARLNDVLEGIDKALEVGLGVKVNAVGMTDLTTSEIRDFMNIFWDKPITLRFIEMMPLWEEGSLQSAYTPNRIILRYLSDAYGIIPIGRDGVSELFLVPSARMKVGFISSVSHPFCHDCDRVRLRADGTLLMCLFSATGLELGRMLRAGTSEEKLRSCMRAFLANKKQEREFSSELTPSIRRIGG